ncbi:hypothetical protein [[Clostridium] polysaccharolyticum]|uniref:Putative membrane protein n=1 Tax=[Clostridium] polysaccharolyticum TaxID=29364 RepID=A0A1I0DJI6_9FIRM|nr:hypothetical protein [[Clostridium] polysaccharolyticum]SET32599.1 putative membrane protein [[Clostridium] polysaccharolyticum]
MNRNRQIKKICTAGLTAALALGVGITGFSYASNLNGTVRENQTIITETAKVKAAGNKIADNHASSQNSLWKDEAVYALADPSGAISDITVADWLKNAGGNGSLSDISNLTDIVNTKGNETFTQNGSNITWETGNEDIYYQGKSSDSLPVGVTFTYKLDGKKIKPAELAGKSGSLEIQIKYANYTKEKTTINGKGAELSTPFVMATALLLPTETFANVQIDNGRILSDGDKVVAVGYGMPGMQESLDLSKEINLTIPDTVTLTADVTNFTMGSTLTYASSDLLNDFSGDDIYDVDSLKKDLEDLKDASKKLVDGSGDLTDGLKTLKDKSGEFADGVDALADGIHKFSKGIDTLKTGITEYTNGVSTLVNGTKAYVNGAGDLCNGITDYTNGADTLIAGISTLSGSLTAMPDQLKALSNGYSQVMDGINQLASKDNMTALSNGASSLSDGITAAHNGLTAIEGGVSQINSSLAQLEESFSKNQAIITGLKAALAAVNDAAAKQQLQGIITSLETLSTQQKTAISQLKASTSSDSQLGKGIHALVNTTDSKGQLKGGAEQLKGGITKFGAGAAKLQGALPQLQQGTNKFAEATKQLPSALNALTSGANKLGSNSKALRQGASKLKSSGQTLIAGGNKLTANNATLKNGVNQLSAASGQLLAGSSKLSDGTVQLTDGIGKLYDGSVTLHDGMKTFDKDGIQKLYNTVNSDLKGVLDRLDALKELGNQYTSFSGKSDSMGGAVKFIIKTDEIK